MAKAKTAAQKKAAKDAVNAARRAKRVETQRIKRDAANTGLDTTKEKHGKDDKTLLVSLGIDRGTLPLDIVIKQTGYAELSAAALATGHVRYNDILYLVDKKTGKIIDSMIVLNPLQF